MSIAAGALVPVATTGNLPQGSGAANICNPSNTGNWTPLERIFPTDCRAPNLSTADPLDLQQLWAPGLDRGLSTEEGATLNINGARSEEHTSELQSLMRISYAVFCLKKKNNTT